MQLIIEPYKYEALESVLKDAVENHKHGIKSFGLTSDRSGVITTNDVTIEYFYDPGFQRLSFLVGKRWSLAAKIAPEQVIYAHIAEIIHEAVANVQLPSIVRDEKQEVTTDNTTTTENKTSIFKKAGE